MITQTIEKTLREFNWDNYGLHEFEDIADPDTHQWPPDLAKQIAHAVARDVAQIVEQTRTSQVWGERHDFE